MFCGNNNILRTSTTKMAAVGSRLTLGAESGTGEQEKDANSQLIELDKGEELHNILKYTNIGA